MLSSRISRKIKTVVTTLLGVLFLTAVFTWFVPHVLAQASLGLEFTQGSGLGTVDVKILIARIVRIILGFLGIIAVIINIYAGYLWMTSQGEEEKIEKAKKILLNGIIGLVIVLSSYLIVSYVINRFTEATIVGNEPVNNRNDYIYNGEALGGGILENVFPEPGSNGVPRNVLIMVTFKEDIDPETVLNSGNVPAACNGFADGTCGFLKSFNINGSIEPSVKIINRSQNNQVLATDEVVAMTNDNRTFVFDPVAYLGSGNGDTNYSINLTDQIRKTDDSPAFLPGGYLWSFGVSSNLDLVPPRIASVLPVFQGMVAKNTTVQINFSEAINAISATGVATGNPQQPFNNVLISYTDQNNNILYMSGTAVISNRFRTIEFTSSIPCQLPEGFETNSCGVVPTCFPGPEDFEILVTAAQVNANGETIDLLSGITDAAGNSLDGNSNGRAEGPATDNYRSYFSTTADLDLTPPFITAISPVQADLLVPKNFLIEADFNEMISAGSVISDHFKIFETSCNGSPDFPQSVGCYPAGGFSVYKEDVNNTSRALLRTYNPYLDGLKSYNPRLNTQIKDLYQNCFNPAIGPCVGDQDSPGCPQFSPIN